MIYSRYNYYLWVITTDDLGQKLDWAIIFKGAVTFITMKGFPDFYRELPGLMYLFEEEFINRCLKQSVAGDNPEVMSVG